MAKLALIQQNMNRISILKSIFNPYRDRHDHDHHHQHQHHHDHDHHDHHHDHHHNYNNRNHYNHHTIILTIINYSILLQLLLISNNFHTIICDLSIQINQNFNNNSNINQSNNNNNNNNNYEHYYIQHPSPNESLLASEHYNFILKYGKCQYPQQKIINIQMEFRNTSATKKYIPHCTILHRCGDSSGCCRLETEHCVPKRTVDVKLYFWTIEITKRGHKKGIEVITMKNHTECMCAPINSNHNNHHQNNHPKSLHQLMPRQINLNHSTMNHDNSHQLNIHKNNQLYSDTLQQQQQQQHKPQTSSASSVTTRAPSTKLISMIIAGINSSSSTSPPTTTISSMIT